MISYQEWDTGSEIRQVVPSPPGWRVLVMSVYDGDAYEIYENPVVAWALIDAPREHACPRAETPPTFEPLFCDDPTDARAETTDCLCGNQQLVGVLGPGQDRDGISDEHVQWCLASLRERRDRRKQSKKGKK